MFKSLTSCKSGESMISAIFHWQLDRKKSAACLHFDREMGDIFGGHGCFSFFRKKMNPHMLLTLQVGVGNCKVSKIGEFPAAVSKLY